MQQRGYATRSRTPCGTSAGDHAPSRREKLHARCCCGGVQFEAHNQAGPRRPVASVGAGRLGALYLPPGDV